jgi:hypothetical protein
MSGHGVQTIKGLLARFNEGDSEALGELVSPSFTTYVPRGDEPSATDVFARYAAEFKAAAPDLAVDIPDLSSGADELMRGTAEVSGTWQHDLWGAPASGERYAFEIPVTVRRIDRRYAFNLDLDGPGAMAILRRLGLVNPLDQMHIPPRYPVELDDFLLKLIFDGQVADKPCVHLADVKLTRTTSDTCDDCEPGEIWPTVRMCLTCGHMGCCDTSTNKHAKAHWEQMGHPLIRSTRMDEGWLWCYEDNAAFQKRMLDGIEARLGTAG